MIPVIIGALRTIPKSLETSLIEVGIKKEGIRTLIERMQKLALLGTVKELPETLKIILLEQYNERTVEHCALLSC